MTKWFRLLICLTGLLGLWLGFGLASSAVTASPAKAAERQANAIFGETASPGLQAAIITSTIVSSFTVPGNRGRGLAWGAGSLWLLDENRQIYRLSPTGTVQSSFPISFNAGSLAWDRNSLWLSDDTNSRLVQLDTTGRVSATLPIWYWYDSGLAWNGNDLYAADYNFSEVHKHQRSGTHLLSWEIHSDSGVEHPTGMAFDGQNLWIGESCEGFENNIARISLLGELLDSFDLGRLGQGIKSSANCTWPEIKGLAWDGQYLWYTANDLFTVYKLDVGAAPPEPPPGSTYARVLAENGQPLAGAHIYHNGYPVINASGAPLVTDAAGNLILPNLKAGDTLVALASRYKQPTGRQAHAGWAYQVYITSLGVNNNGSLQPFTVVRPTGPQTLTVKLNNTLALFNLVISIEWDATERYISEILQAAQRGSHYLYDVTDGQMAFGRVAIYDNGQSWADADIQIAASNVVQPHAHIGGITSSDRSRVIRLGRAWSGNSGNQGPWNHSAGFRTLVHEFGHYGLYLYDEYLFYVLDEQGNILRREHAACVGRQNRDRATEATNASIMDYQYTSTELAMQGVPGQWSDSCKATLHWQMTGESDWETVRRKYADTAQPARWRWRTPADRGAVLVGPDQLPDTVLALPQIIVKNNGVSNSQPRLTVYGPDYRPLRVAIVALYKKSGLVINQGLTDNSGRIDIYGADAGDELRVASFDGGLFGVIDSIGTEPNLNLVLAPVGEGSAQAAGQIPHMRVVAGTSPGLDQINLMVSLQGFGPNANPYILVTEPDSDIGHAPPLGYNAGNGAYEGQISFSATGRGMGRIQAAGVRNNSSVFLQSTYRLQRVTNNQDHDVYSNDGNFSLHLKPGSLPGNEAYFVVMPPGAIPGPLPAGLTLVGDPYDVTASGALATLKKPAILTLHYDKALVNQASPPAGLSIYRWDPNQPAAWRVVPGTVDQEHQAMTARVTALGIYALMAPPGSWTEPVQNKIYLPSIMR